MNNTIKPLESRSIRVTEFNVQELGKHALTLPQGHPARATIMLLLARYENAPVIRPQLEAVAA